MTNTGDVLADPGSHASHGAADASPPSVSIPIAHAGEAAPREVPALPFPWEGRKAWTAPIALSPATIEAAAIAICNARCGITGSGRRPAAWHITTKTARATWRFAARAALIAAINAGAAAAAQGMAARSGETGTGSTEGNSPVPGGNAP